ncbi:MAG: hypothetical protein LW853_00430 [Rickettsiales bacterium]|nr:hypothetical protein [Rickettsiales bacterium]
MSDKETGSQSNRKDSDGEYGKFSKLVNLITDVYSEKSAEALRNGPTPIYITPYNQWTEKDFIKLHDRFSNVYSSFVSLFNAVGKKIETNEDRKDAEDAKRAMIRLSGLDPNKPENKNAWFPYAKMIHNADQEIQRRKGNSAPQKKSSLDDNALPEAKLVGLAEAGVMLDSNQSFVFPDPTARAVELVAAMRSKDARAA